MWCPVILAQTYPNLFLSATNAKASVHDIINAPDLVSIFNFPLSQLAYHELGELQNAILEIHYDENLKDGWIFSLG